MALYDELGGDPAISAALDQFYSKVLDDDRFTHYFENVDMDRLKGHQRKFFAMALGGPNEYEGRDLRTAHTRPRNKGLDEDGYHAFMDLFRDTLVELGVDEPRIDQVMAIADTGKDDVLGS